MMKRRIFIVSVFVAVCLATASYVWISESPEAARERFLKRGREYALQGKLPEAIIMFKNAVKADPTSAEARYETGLALLQKRDFRSAFAELRHAADLNPRLIGARYQLGILYTLSRDLPHAKEQLDQIREQDQSSREAKYLSATIALAEKDPDRALQDLRELLTRSEKQNSPDIAKMYVEIGSVYAIKKNWQAAETSYRKALAIEPTFLPARVALTGLYLATGQEEKAEEELVIATRAEPENEQLLHVLGNFYSQSRRFDEYESLYRDLLQKKPKSMVAKKRMTEILLMRGEMKEASAHVEQILKERPDDTDGHYFRGRLYLAERNYQKANDELSLVTNKQPMFGSGFYHLALAQIGLKQMRQGRGSLLKAAELAPLWLPPRLTLAQVYLTSGDHELAWQESERILKLSPDNRSALLVAGAAQLRKGDAGKALTLFRKAQSLNPKDPAPYINLGAVYVIQKNYAQALKEYAEALRLDSDRFEALSSIAGIHVALGNRHAAFDRVQQHLTKTKRQAEVHELLGQLSLQGKDYGKGIEHFERAIQLNPELLSAYLLIGNAYATQRKFDRAIEEYEKVIQKNPQAIPPYMLLGILHELKQQPAKANEYYKKLLDINKEFVPAANNLAWNYAEHGGNLDSALALAQKARELSPENPQIADTLGWIYYKKGAYASAIGLLKESTEKLQNKNPTVLYHLGMAQHRGGDTASARENLKKALAMDQTFRGAEEARQTLIEMETAKNAKVTK
jgi:tetratricopeptide (TPR) repeat protein